MVRAELMSEALVAERATVTDGALRATVSAALVPAILV